MPQTDSPAPAESEAPEADNIFIDENGLLQTRV
jgi:hypothetical protein